MLLFLTVKVCPSIDIMMHICKKKAIPAFRFNFDMFNSYKFLWNNTHFEIEDPIGLRCSSNKLDGIICYHGRMLVDQSFDNSEAYFNESKWVISWLNHLHDCLLYYGIEQKNLRLFSPMGIQYAKTFQMEKAKKYFCVPDFYLHWGRNMPHHNVIAKTLTQRPFSTGATMYAKITDQGNLDQMWPWFTQEIAKGNRDATVLYVNGKIHCYQFATERGNLTDWRITQGTAVNKWEPWNAGKSFENKVRTYMQDIKLKYGRLDFIIGGKEPQFLEVNPCGQFGWLDDEKLTLHNEVVDAILDPASTIEL